MADQPPPELAPRTATRLAHVIRWLPGALRSGGAQRARWGLLDQVLSSLTNFGLTAVVAHQVAPDEFGSFSLALAVYILSLWVARSVVGEPFVVRLTEAPAATAAAAARQALGAALVVGIVWGAGMVAAGGFLGENGRPMQAMGLFLPGLLVQDGYRYVLMAAGRVRSATASDGIWLILQWILFVALLLGGRAGAVALTAAFGVAATAAGLVAWRRTRVAPAPRAWWTWLRAHRDLGIPFVLELVTVNGATQLSMVAIAAFGGVVAVGELRAAVLLLGPTTVVCSGLFLVAIPEAVRMRNRSLPGLAILVYTLAISMSLAILAWAAVLLLVPASAGEALLGANWARGRHVLIPMAVMTAANGAIIAAIVGLRALEAARQSLRVRVWAGPVILASGGLGAVAAGGRGAAIGLALSSWVSAFLAFVVLRGSLRNEAIRIVGLAASADRAPHLSSDATT